MCIRTDVSCTCLHKKTYFIIIKVCSACAADYVVMFVPSVSSSLLVGILNILHYSGLHLFTITAVTRLQVYSKLPTDLFLKNF